MPENLPLALFPIWISDSFLWVFAKVLRWLRSWQWIDDSSSLCPKRILFVICLLGFGFCRYLDIVLLFIWGYAMAGQCVTWELIWSTLKIHFSLLILKPFALMRENTFSKVLLCCSCEMPQMIISSLIFFAFLILVMTNSICFWKLSNVQLIPYMSHLN